MKKRGRSRWVRGCLVFVSLFKISLLCLLLGLGSVVLVENESGELRAGEELKPCVAVALVGVLLAALATDCLGLLAGLFSSRLLLPHLFLIAFTLISCVFTAIFSGVLLWSAGDSKRSDTLSVGVRNFALVWIRSHRFVPGLDDESRLEFYQRQLGCCGFYASSDWTSLTGLEVLLDNLSLSGAADYDWSSVCLRQSTQQHCNLPLSCCTIKTACLKKSFDVEFVLKTTCKSALEALVGKWSMRMLSACLLWVVLSGFCLLTTTLVWLDVKAEAAATAVRNKGFGSIPSVLHPEFASADMDSSDEEDYFKK